MTARAQADVAEGRVGRYLLDDLVARTAGSQLWRASDPALDRPVAARLVPLADPRCGLIREAARQAAAVHDRHIVQVLDVVETSTHLAVITEWVPGQTWDEVIGQEWPPEEIALVALELARALQSAHACGTSHGRIRPSSLVISDTNEVRLRGLGVDAVLYGIWPTNDPVRADLHGVGAVVYSGLTGRWPGPPMERGAVDGIPLAAPVGGVLPAPDELTADVPQQLSRIAMRCLAGLPMPKRVKPWPDLDHAVAALAREVEAASAAPRRRTVPWRTVAVGSALLAVLAAGSTAVLLDGRPDPSLPVAPVAADRAPAPAGAAGSVGGFAPKALPLASATDFDPYGRDGVENPDLVPLAIDGDPATAWLTVSYKNSDMRPKAGTGLLIDLGIARPISEVRLQLAGTGTDVELRYGDTLARTERGFELLAAAVGAGGAIAIRTPAPVQTRYLLIWLKNLPYTDGAYQGGVREVRLLG